MITVSFARNVIFSVVLLLIIGSVSYVNLPLTDRFEEYVAFVLTTDFDYEVWVEKAAGPDLFQRFSQMWTWIPWFNDDPWPGEAVPVGPADGTR